MDAVYLGLAALLFTLLLGLTLACARLEEKKQ